MPIFFNFQPYGDYLQTSNLEDVPISAFRESHDRYGVRNLEMTIRFSLKSRLFDRFHRPEMSQIKAEIHLGTNM